MRMYDKNVEKSLLMSDKTMASFAATPTSEKRNWPIVGMFCTSATVRGPSCRSRQAASSELANTLWTGESSMRLPCLFVRDGLLPMVKMRVYRRY